MELTRSEVEAVHAVDAQFSALPTEQRRWLAANAARLSRALNCDSERAINIAAALLDHRLRQGKPVETTPYDEEYCCQLLALDPETLPSFSSPADGTEDDPFI